MKDFAADFHEHLTLIYKGQNKLELLFTTPYKDPPKKIYVTFNYNNTHNYTIGKNVTICSIEDCDDFIFDLFEYERVCGWGDCTTYYKCLY